MTKLFDKRLEKLEAAMLTGKDRLPGLSPEEKEVLLTSVEAYAEIEAKCDELYGKDGAVGFDESQESSLPPEKRLLRQRIIDGCRG